MFLDADAEAAVRRGQIKKTGQTTVYLETGAGVLTMAADGDGAAFANSAATTAAAAALCPTSYPAANETASIVYTEQR